jgi:hypothetical protein
MARALQYGPDEMKRTVESNEALNCFLIDTEREIMKPTSVENRNARQSPLVDYHYHSATLGGACGRCYVRQSPSKSLRDISRDYFDSEVNSDFLSDAAVFVALIAAVMVPIVSGVSAVLELFRTLPL